jgi:hypothetical protein
MEMYVKRLQQLEGIARQHRFVEEAYAIQAGREVRVVVDAKQADDAYAFKIAQEIAKQVEKEMTFPGEIKVTVLRETRAEATASTSGASPTSRALRAAWSHACQASTSGSAEDQRLARSASSASAGRCVMIGWIACSASGSHAASGWDGAGARCSGRGSTSPAAAPPTPARC